MAFTFIEIETTIDENEWIACQLDLRFCVFSRKDKMIKNAYMTYENWNANLAHVYSFFQVQSSLAIIIGYSTANEVNYWVWF